MVQLLWKTELPYDPAIPLLGTYPRGLKTHHTKMCTHVFIEAVLIVPQKNEKIQRPSADAWLIKRW